MERKAFYNVRVLQAHNKTILAFKLYHFQLEFTYFLTCILDTNNFGRALAVRSFVIATRWKG